MSSFESYCDGLRAANSKDIEELASDESSIFLLESDGDLKINDYLHRYPFLSPLESTKSWAELTAALMHSCGSLKILADLLEAPSRAKRQNSLSWNQQKKERACSGK